MNGRGAFLLIYPVSDAEASEGNVIHGIDIGSVHQQFQMKMGRLQGFEEPCSADSADNLASTDGITHFCHVGI